jgi:hypothetical protein
VMRRYSAYSANQVMTTTAATSMISKNNTTAEILAAAAQRFSAAVGQVTGVAIRTWDKMI